MWSLNLLADWLDRRSPIWRTAVAVFAVLWIGGRFDLPGGVTFAAAFAAAYFGLRPKRD